jgi:hypothetical protein
LEEGRFGICQSSSPEFTWAKDQSTSLGIAGQMDEIWNAFRSTEAQAVTSTQSYLDNK